MSDDCGNCPEHTGQVEKIRGVNGRMNLLITLMLLQLAGTGMFYNQVADQSNLINKLTTTVEVNAKRLDLLESSLSRYQAASDEYRRRLDLMERSVKP